MAAVVAAILSKTRGRHNAQTMLLCLHPVDNANLKPQYLGFGES